MTVESSIDRAPKKDETIVFDPSDMAIAAMQLQDLMDRENQPVDWTQKLRLPSRITDFEKTILLNNGVDEKYIKEGELTRTQLWEAGFVFINTIGNGEKPILSVVFSDEYGCLDTTNRTLLTADEISRVKKFQLNQGMVHNPPDDAPDDYEEMLRGHMLWFLGQADRAVRSVNDKEIEIFRHAQTLIIEKMPQHKEAVCKSIGSYRDGKNDITFFMQECTNGVVFARVGEVPVDIVNVRRNKLKGLPSPFIDSGYSFANNTDVTIFPLDPEKTRRLNAVTIHLLSRGIVEIGSSTNGSHDQTYITAEEYKELMQQIHARPPELSEFETKMVAGRILVRAGVGIDEAERLLASLK